MRQEIVPVIAVAIIELSSIASGKSSKIATYPIAPAAKPKPPGNNTANRSTNK